MKRYATLIFLSLLSVSVLALPGFIYAVEAEISDTNFLFPTNVGVANSSVTDVNYSDGSEQIDPKTMCYIVDTNCMSLGDEMGAPNSTVLGLDIDEQDDPSMEAYIIDTNFMVADSSNFGLNTHVLGDNSPEVGDPDNEAYIIDTNFMVHGKQDLRFRNFTDSNVSIPVSDFDFIADGFGVSFVSRCSDPQGFEIVSYAWDFGDGKLSYFTNPNHVYSMRGAYIVRLTVTNSEGYTSSRTKMVYVAPETISAVLYPDKLPIGSKLSVRVKTDVVSDITFQIDGVLQTKTGTNVVFNYDTSVLGLGSHSFDVSVADDSYAGAITVYREENYRQIVRGLNELESVAVDEMTEISGTTGYVLTSHAYSVVMSLEVAENRTVGDVVNEIRGLLSDVDNATTREIERLDSILIALDGSMITQTKVLYDAADSLRSLQQRVRSFNAAISDDNIVAYLNRYHMTPALYYVFNRDEAADINARTLSTVDSLDGYYPPDDIALVESVFTVGREAIRNTHDEVIYDVHLGTILGHEFSLSPNLDYFADMQALSMSPPGRLGKNDPRWVYRMTVADVQSILTVPAYVGWIDAAPEDEVISPTASVRVAPIIMLAKAVKMYMKYADMLQKASPWIIDGGMIISTDILSQEVDEEHADVISAVNSILGSSGASTASVMSPTVTAAGVSVPAGNVIATASPDGRITGFVYAREDYVAPAPVLGTIVSMSTGWTYEPEDDDPFVGVSILADYESYALNDTVNLTVVINSSEYIEDSMVWVFVPEENVSVADVVEIESGANVLYYNFTVRNDAWHVPRVFVSVGGMIVAENHTSFAVGEGDFIYGLIDVGFDESYGWGSVAVVNVTVSNAGNVPFEDARLEYVLDGVGVNGSVLLGAVGAGESLVAALEFNLTEPDYYAGGVALSVGDDVLDYGVFGFYVAARGTYIAFPDTDKVVYLASESVDVDVVIKNLTLDVVDAQYAVETVSPSGVVLGSERFVPHENGTYIVRAKATEPGYYSVEGETIFVVERQSLLEIDVDRDGNRTDIRVSNDAGGVVDGAVVFVNGYRFVSDSDGLVLFDEACDNVTVVAEKFGFDPCGVFVDFELNGTGTVDDELSLNINPANQYVVFGESYSDVSVEPLGNHGLEIMNIVCKDLNSDGVCEDILYNPSGEISVMFEGAGRFVNVSGGESARIVIGLDLDGVEESAEYIYYVRADGGDWHEAKVTYVKDNPAIPEFPAVVVVVMAVYTFVMVRRKI